MDVYDAVDVNGYSFINIPRKQKFIRKSGGLGAFVKTDLFKGVEVIHGQSDYAFWFVCFFLCFFAFTFSGAYIFICIYA